MPTDITEKGLEAILVRGLVEAGWTEVEAEGYLPAYAVDLDQLGAFLEATQADVAAALDLDNATPARKKFLDRLSREITTRGVIDVLRKGVKDGPHHVNLFYGTPSEGNTAATERFNKNRFTVVRQLHFSPANAALSLDVCCFINGLPVVTMELKNQLTKQDVDDAVEQYKTDRDPREPLFQFKRTVVHLAVDDNAIKFCTRLAGKASWFLPFNKGHNQGAGNPPNPNGLKTSYLWEEVLTPTSLTNIIENYAHFIELEDEDPKTRKKRKREVQIWPRYHQIDVVRKLLGHASEHGPGQRYLIQHSAGSGKSNSIAWLVHQIIGLKTFDDSGLESPVFDSVFVVTDRKVLDKQIRDTIKQFAQVGATVGAATKSSELLELIVDGKKIIITTVQKFPFIVDTIGDKHRDRSFAIVIDEAHSSQSGRTASALAKSLQGKAPDSFIESVDVLTDEETPDIDEELDGDEADPVQDLINAAMQGRKMASNASYFAFTATPKNKTLEMFGTPFKGGEDTKFRPFHSYSMKQAIEEGFILDVLQSYTTVKSYYKLTKTVSEDPEFDSQKAEKKLRAFVEGNKHAIRVKAEIMVDHFLDQVIGQGKIGGEARAMVITGSIRRAMEYFHAISEVLAERGDQYKAIVAFSGEHEYGGTPVTESSLNGFPSNDIPSKIKQDPYRFLICADKFQTGYDEPLLHTMYVDKVLSGVKAVQTLSRLNRAHPKKHDVFVLDFQNDVDAITDAFAPYYRTTVLAEETDPNKLHDLVADLDSAEVYTEEDLNTIVSTFLQGAPRDQLDPILDACAAKYTDDLDEDAQIKFKGSAKAFVRTYDFLASILTYENADWEKRSIFLNLLIPKLPAPDGDDLAKGILEAIDMESYRAEKQTTAKILLPNEDGEVTGIPGGTIGGKPDPELEKLSAIIQSFNDLFGNIEWSDSDRITRFIALDLPAKVNADVAYQNAKRNSDKQNARVEHDRALTDAIIETMNDDAELFKQFMQNALFKKWLSDRNFAATYETA